MGNLLPAAFVVPFLVMWITRYKKFGIWDSQGLWWLAAAPVAGWVAVNFFGLYGNRQMRIAMERRLMTDGHDMNAERHFVGMARPAYSNALDPHEDVGFLIVHPDRLVFVGDTKRIELTKASLLGIRFRRNIHSWVLLGRWISIEGTFEGQPVRLYVEPRAHGTLLKNRAEGKRLLQRLQEWLKKPTK